MTTQDSDFWRRMGDAAPGLFEIGTSVYGRNQGGKEAAGRLATAQGPLYQQSMDAASNQLQRGGSFDPKAAGAERYKAQQGMLAGTDAATLDDLMRRMQVSGTSGVSTFSGQQGGPAVNPHMAAFMKAKADRDAKLAVDSLDHGEAQLDRYLNRAGMMQQNAARTQQSGLQAQMTQPSRAAANNQLLKGVGGLMKNKDVMGLLGKGADWLGDKTGMWGGPMNNFMSSSYSPGYDDYSWDWT